MIRAIRKTSAASLAIAVSALIGSTAAAARGDVEAGHELVTKKYACASCHGANFATPIDPSYPKLAGQHEDYLRFALLAYQRGEHPTYGRGNPVMAAQAKPLSAREIDDIAAYLSRLPPSVVLKR